MTQYRPFARSTVGGISAAEQRRRREREELQALQETQEALTQRSGALAKLAEHMLARNAQLHHDHLRACRSSVVLAEHQVRTLRCLHAQRSTADAAILHASTALLAPHNSWQQPFCRRRRDKGVSSCIRRVGPLCRA